MRLNKDGLIKLFSVSVVDQVLLSGANFLIGFLLIRHTTDFDYGMFVLVQSAILLLTSAQSAWLSGPLMARAPQKDAQTRHEMVGTLEQSQNRFLLKCTLICLAVPPIGYVLHAWNGLVACVAGVGILAGWMALKREYVRSVLLIYSRPGDLLRADIIYVAILVGGAIVATSGLLSPEVLWAVGALAAAGLAGSMTARRAQQRTSGWTCGSNAAPFWLELRSLGIWATVGTVIYWLFAQSYNYILASQVDLKAVADVNATRLILMPAFVITIGIKGFLTPSAARWLIESNISGLVKRLLAIIVVIAVLDLIYFFSVWFFRDWLTSSFMQKDIHDRDRLLILWSIVALTGMSRDMLQTALLVLGKLKPLAWLSAASAAVALTIMWFGIGKWGPAAVLIGQIAGELLSLLGVILILQRYMVIKARS